MATFASPQMATRRGQLLLRSLVGVALSAVAAAQNIRVSPVDPDPQLIDPDAISSDSQLGHDILWSVLSPASNPLPGLTPIGRAHGETLVAGIWELRPGVFATEPGAAALASLTATARADGVFGADVNATLMPVPEPGTLVLALLAATATRRAR